MKRVAITGASGFVGHHVLDELLKHNLEIVAVTRDASLLSKYAHKLKVVEFDIANIENNLFDKLGSPDVLIHLAWGGLPNYKSLHHYETELPNQYNFLKNMIQGGLTSVLITGTCFEYGMQSGMLSADVETKPNNPYGYAKDALRKQLEYLKAVKPFNLCWARLFYMYGENQSANSLYPKLIEAVKRGDKVFNMSGGQQLRDYLPVKEVARKIVNFALAQYEVGLVNICSGQPISVREQVEKWLIENNWKINLNLGYYPYPDYEPMEFWGKP
jgi:dTDP-6-deoxy-L-talose 4-dehydrogenase (NAD+)